MSDDELWRHHAYVYGFRRVVYADFGKTSPLDGNGDWFNPSMAAAAERLFKRKFDRKDRGVPVGPRDWRQIRSPDLTEDEREIAMPAIERMAILARKYIAEAEEKWRRAFAGSNREMPHGGRNPRSVPPPPPLADENDPRVREWMAELGAV